MYTSDRSALRKVFIEAWRLRRANQPLEPLQALLAEIIQQHPEYHALLEGEGAVTGEWTPEQGESNPFLHLSMHSAILEQVSMDRPAGIRDAYHALSTRLGDAHQAEHQIMECLGTMIWSAQQQGGVPDEQAYLVAVQRLL